MFSNDPHSGCRWVRDRLPLLVGGELAGLERRKVERHLIACTDCRRERTTLARSLGALHAAAESPMGLTGSTASLWPALERQIRECRHAGAQPVFARPNFLEWLEIHLRVRPSLAALTLALAGLTILGVGIWSRLQTSAANAEVLAASQPLEPILDRVIPEPAPIDSSPMSNVAQTESSSTSTSRVDYDLDHGTPMGPDTRGIKSSY
jgi:predicted anti-sigma-YlaC factor YlaD